jgi:hypothetical protein
LRFCIPTAVAMSTATVEYPGNDFLEVIICGLNYAIKINYTHLNFHLFSALRALPNSMHRNQAVNEVTTASYVGTPAVKIDVCSAS